MRLKGKVAIITGAATGLQGSVMGFGGAAAWRFLREGAKVVVTDIDSDSGQATVSQMKTSGFDAEFMYHDVTNSSDWERVVADTISIFGVPDVLVNNAGNSARFNVEETSEEAWKQQIDVHAKAVFLGSREVIPSMRMKGAGSIVNVSSIYGLVGSPTVTAYHAGKGASRILTKSIAVQYAKDNIRVNCLSPTGVYNNHPEEFVKKLSNIIPMGRMADIDEYKGAIVFLCSDASSYMTGENLVIDGGKTVW